MPEQQNITNIPSNRVEFIDSRTGMVSREWYRFFLNLFNLAGGGGNQTSLDDLQIGPPPMPDSGTGGGGGGSGTVTSVDVSGGTTGLTTSGGPVTGSGTITLAGTLNIANGGTGATTAAGAPFALKGANADITSMTGITGGISSPDFVQFDTAATVTDATGRLYYDNADQYQTLAFQMNGARIQHVGEELYYRVKLSSAVTKGQVLMFTGTLGASGGLQAAPATGLTVDQSNYILGLAAESGATNDWITVVEFGEVKGIDTTGGAEIWAQGEVLYYNPLVTGGLTKTKPATPAAIAVMAAVVHVGTANGILFVRPTFGSVLGGTDGNVRIASLASGNTLIYDAVAGVWKNTNLTDGTGINITEGAGSITIANSAPDQIVSLTGAGTTTVTGTYPNFTITSNDQYVGTVTSVTGTSPVVSSGGATPAISLASGYGDTQNPYASKTANYFLASPNGTAGVPTFRAVTAADIPTLNQNTTGTAANVTGVVAIANGGTGQTTAVAAFDALSPATTKGDLIVSNGTDNVRLAVGTDAYVLTADSTAATGVKWAAASGGSSNITAQGLWENSATISANYTIGTGNNAMSAGPISVASGVTVTVPTGSSWAVV